MSDVLFILGVVILFAANALGLVFYRSLVGRWSSDPKARQLVGNPATESLVKLHARDSWKSIRAAFTLARSNQINVQTRSAARAFLLMNLVSISSLILTASLFLTAR